MATKTETRLIDDLDGQEADETVRFGLDGEVYEIDLSIKHAEELRDALTLYVENGRKASGRRGRRAAAEGSQPAERRDPEAPKIREWAREHGIEVPPRGRIPEDVKEQYRTHQAAPPENAATDAIAASVDRGDVDTLGEHVNSDLEDPPDDPPDDEDPGDFEWDDSEPK